MSKGKNKVVKTEGALGGKPRIKNTRVSVEQIIHEVMKENDKGFGDISDLYPAINERDVESAVVYALKNPDFYYGCVESFTGVEVNHRND